MRGRCLLTIIAYLCTLTCTPMKILLAADIKLVDEYTIAHEPISSVALIERVAQVLRGALARCFPEHNKLVVVCGKGKNAADGMALALLLHGEREREVRLVCCYPPQELCPEAAHFYAKAVQHGLRCELCSSHSMPALCRDELVVDCLFGTGLSRTPAGYERQLVQAVNGSGCCVVAVDIPSGMMADGGAASDVQAVVQAHSTLTLHAPKLALLLPECGSCAGQLHVLDIGLHPEAIAQVSSNYHYVTPAELRSMLRPRPKFSHKGDYGKALLVAGSRGMMGAAVLASRACLHAGVGLLTTHVPGCGVDILQTAVPEAMLSIDASDDHFSGLPGAGEKRYSAIAAGCGMGCSGATSAALESLLRKASGVPLVLDADALNVIAAHRKLLGLLPEGTILTPHVGEFERLVGACSSSLERLRRQQELACRRKVVVVLKGAHTAVALPDGRVFFSSTGNAGMATAGSGDVLTGVVLALLAQGYAPAQAAVLGVGLHGMAGDKAASATSPMHVTASDIVSHLYALERWVGSKKAER